MINIVYAAVAAFILAADQLVKLFITRNFELYECFGSIGRIVDFVHVRNTGAAFSIMSGKVEILSVISIVFCVGVLVYWIKKRPVHPLLCTSLSMLAAGALGNAIDRIFRGYVVDFISLAFVDFPVFNIADMAITVGAVLIIIYVMFFDRENKNKEDKNK